MKKVLLQIGMITLLLSLTACSEAASLDSTNTTQGTTEASSTMVIVVTDESDASTVITENVTEREKANTDESSDPAPKNTDTATVETSTSTETQTTDSTSEPKQQKTNTSVTINVTDDMNSNTENVSEEISSEELSPTSPYDIEATSDVTNLIAERVIYYINKYREEENHIVATVLPGLTEFCKYRSGQLISNFAHDTNDIRAAATDLKYGKYIDPSVYGISGEPYYQGGGREAIGRGFMSCETVDNLAMRIATGFRNSVGHWTYIGSQSRSYKYIGAGITIYKGTWYCCVSVSENNEDEIK